MPVLLTIFLTNGLLAAAGAATDDALAVGPEEGEADGLVEVEGDGDGVAGYGELAALMLIVGNEGDRPLRRVRVEVMAGGPIEGLQPVDLGTIEAGEQRALPPDASGLLLWLDVSGDAMPLVVRVSADDVAPSVWSGTVDVPDSASIDAALAPAAAPLAPAAVERSVAPRVGGDAAWGQVDAPPSATRPTLPSAAPSKIPPSLGAARGISARGGAVPPSVPAGGPLERAPRPTDAPAAPEAPGPALETGAPPGSPLRLATDSATPGAHSGPAMTDPAEDRDGDGYPIRFDCDDFDAAIHPDAPERCDGLDLDCDGDATWNAIDAPRWFRDEDGDGRGDPHRFVAACATPAGYVRDASDPDDARRQGVRGAP